MVARTRPLPGPSRAAAVVAAVLLLLSGCSASAAEHVQGQGHGGHGSTDTYVQLVQDEGPRAALTALQADSRDDPEVASACHHHAHQAGTWAFALYGFEAAAQDRLDLCVAGYVHGLLEAYVGTAGDELPAAMAAACAGSSARTRPGDECFHGVGHGLMTWAQRDRVRALALCASYDEELAARACGDGVWMAAFSPLADEYELAPDAALRLCREQRVQEKASCYRHGSTTAMDLTDPEEYGRGFAWCASAEVPYVRGCVTELGGQLAAEEGTDVAAAEAVCATAAAALVPACIDGMAVSLHPYYNGDPELGRDVCARLQPAHQDGCRRQVQALDASLCPAGEHGCVPQWARPQEHAAGHAGH